MTAHQATDTPFQVSPWMEHRDAMHYVGNFPNADRLKIVCSFLVFVALLIHEFSYEKLPQVLNSFTSTLESLPI